MTYEQIENEIRKGMALAFFASAVADQADECGCPMQGEIMDQLPALIDPAAIHAAQTLAMDMETAAKQKLSAIYLQASQLQKMTGGGDRKITPDLFGHYCAMQAMGHGVGLESFGDKVHDTVTVPYCEFGSHSLQNDYFTAPATYTVTTKIKRNATCAADALAIADRANKIIDAQGISDDKDACQIVLDNLCSATDQELFQLSVRAD